MMGLAVVLVTVVLTLVIVLVDVPLTKVELPGFVWLANFAGFVGPVVLNDCALLPMLITVMYLS
jgi:hypothetical protein